MTIAIGSRACARCWKELKDAASMEAGIGPICRKLDNAVLARMIPANILAAQVAAGLVPYTDLPEPTRETFVQVLADVLDFGTADWRKTVKRIEWILSWGMASSLRKMLIEIVRSLGYVGLAALLAGEASTGTALVVFENDRLYLRASRNKTGAYAFKKEVQGWKFQPSFGATKAAWTAPATSADAFQMVVMTYWPNVSGLEEAVAAAKNALRSVFASETATVKVEKEPEVTVTSISPGWVSVRSPYNVNFVVEIKTLPYKARRWNPAMKTWEIEAVHLPYVQELIQKHYKVESAVVAAAA
jgi:hypothetical protein